MLAWLLVMASVLAPLLVLVALALTRPRRQGIRVRTAGLLALGATIAGLGLGLGAFTLIVASMADRTVATPADGIVALSGRLERLHAAFDLLRQGLAPAALLSGTVEGANEPELARLRALDPVTFDARVTLGRAARDTRGNAAEAAAWAAARGIRRLIVVSSPHHLPRGLVHLGQAMPGVELFAVAVAPGHWTTKGWLPEEIPRRELAGEYLKFLLSPLTAG